MGHLGFTEDQFWDTTPRAFWNAYNAYYEREELKEQTEWERVRWSVWWSVNMQLSANNKIELRDVIIFPWEQEQHRESNILTEEDFKRIEQRDRKFRLDG